MTTLEIILICIVVWLLGAVVILWLDRAYCHGKPDLEITFAVFFWFLAIPIFSIYNLFYNSLRHRKAPKHHGYDEDYACILKLPFGWEKFVIYRNLYIMGGFSDEEENVELTEQNVATALQLVYNLSKRRIRYLRRTKQLTKVTDKLKEIDKQWKNEEE